MFLSERKIRQLISIALLREAVSGASGDSSSAAGKKVAKRADLPDWAKKKAAGYAIQAGLVAALATESQLGDPATKEGKKNIAKLLGVTSRASKYPFDGVIGRRTIKAWNLSTKNANWPADRTAAMAILKRNEKSSGMYEEVLNMLGGLFGDPTLGTKTISKAEFKAAEQKKTDKKAAAAEEEVEAAKAMLTKFLKDKYGDNTQVLPDENMPTDAEFSNKFDVGYKAAKDHIAVLMKNTKALTKYDFDVPRQISAPFRKALEKYMMLKRAAIKSSKRGSLNHPLRAQYDAVIAQPPTISPMMFGAFYNGFVDYLDDWSRGIDLRPAPENWRDLLEKLSEGQYVHMVGKSAFPAEYNSFTDEFEFNRQAIDATTAEEQKKIADYYLLDSGYYVPAGMENDKILAPLLDRLYVYKDGALSHAFETSSATVSGASLVDDDTSETKKAKEAMDKYLKRVDQIRGKELKFDQE